MALLNDRFLDILISVILISTEKYATSMAQNTEMVQNIDHLTVSILNDTKVDAMEF